jgi:hypothetical protein
VEKRSDSLLRLLDDHRPVSPRGRWKSSLIAATRAVKGASAIGAMCWQAVPPALTLRSMPRTVSRTGSAVRRPSVHAPGGSCQALRRPVLSGDLSVDCFETCIGQRQCSHASRLSPKGPSRRVTVASSAVRETLPEHGDEVPRVNTGAKRKLKDAVSTYLSDLTPVDRDRLKAFLRSPSGTHDKGANTTNIIDPSLFWWVSVRKDNSHETHPHDLALVMHRAPRLFPMRSTWIAGLPIRAFRLRDRPSRIQGSKALVMVTMTGENHIDARIEHHLPRGGHPGRGGMVQSRRPARVMEVHQRA